MLCFENVSKTYNGPGGKVEVLKGLNIEIEQGTLAVIEGPSGCGKSTFLFTAGAMLPPDSGKVLFQGRSIYNLLSYERNFFRGGSVGFIFQKFHLIPYLTVEENILYPLRWGGKGEESGSRLSDVASALCIKHRLNHRPAHLSAGEQQRTAVARAIMGDKKIICADEPTGNLDEENASIVLEALRKEASLGKTVLLVTHQKRIYETADISFMLEGGVLVPFVPEHRIDKS